MAQCADAEERNLAAIALLSVRHGSQNSIRNLRSLFQSKVFAAQEVVSGKKCDMEPNVRDLIWNLAKDVVCNLDLAELQMYSPRRHVYW